MTETIRAVVASDLALMREGLSTLLRGYENIEVVGEAADGKEAVDRVLQLAPDVVLMDMTMKVMNGFEATRRLSRQAPKIKTIILVDPGIKNSASEAFLAGAYGCIPKSAISADLASAIKAVHTGDMYLHPSLIKALVEIYLSLRKIGAVEDPYEQLTITERQVLRLLAEGRTGREVAQDMGVAVKTVSNHKANIMRKLGIHNRTELIKYAILRRIIDLKPLTNSEGGETGFGTGSNKN